MCFLQTLKQRAKIRLDNLLREIKTQKSRKPSALNKFKITLVEIIRLFTIDNISKLYLKEIVFEEVIMKQR